MGGDVDYLFGGDRSMNTFQCILKLSFFVKGTTQFQQQHKNLTSMYFLSFEIFEYIFYLNETIKMITYKFRN